MRRVAGAMIVVLVLGARHIPGAFDRGGVPSRPSPAAQGAVFSAAPDSTPSPVAARPADSAAPRAAAAVPESFRAAPLAFLSRAPADSLDLLPGIGPVLATRIADARRGRGSFTSWDDVLAVRGIGPKTIDRLKALTD
jgi:competence protein ComEA